jgi:hypothetical protein
MSVHAHGRPAAEAVDGETGELASRRGCQAAAPEAGDELLRCVHSGYLAGACSCEACVPASVATSAWVREQQTAGSEDRFFRFAWRGEVWLAYGVSGAGVRGVYCPEHYAERTERGLARGVRREADAGLLSAA